jgi:ribosome-associated protein
LNHLDAFDVARVAARAADEKLGQDILVVDVRRESTLVDCFLLVTGMTHLHIAAIEDAVREALRAGGANLVRTDGQRGHLWRALDYGNFIVHIMDKKTREFYAIEKLWERGKPLTWKMPAPKKRPVKPKPKTSSPRQAVGRGPGSPKRKNKTTRKPVKKSKKK